jgi:hypothetical protein
MMIREMEFRRVKRSYRFVGGEEKVSLREGKGRKMRNNGKWQDMR